MTMDIKELQKAIVAEVNRREYERLAPASSMPTQAARLPNELVRTFELVDVASLLPPLPEPPAAPVPTAEAVAQPEPAPAPGGFKQRVANLFERARQRPGHPLKNSVILMVRAGLYRVPGLRGVLYRLSRMPELITFMEQHNDRLHRMPEIIATMEQHNAHLRNVSLRLQEHVNRSLYSHALATEQNEQALAIRQQVIEQRLRDLSLKPAATPAQGPASTAPAAAADAPAADMPHDLYLAFEAEFRGSRELIRDRLAANLHYFSDNAKRFSEPVMDIGCGRGEWLQLLKEAGIPALGVDTNTVMVQCCLDAGLQAHVDDALHYMQQLPDNSLGGLTAFHIIEHVPLNVLIQIIDEARRVVRPGGVVLFETPNPENLIVGACNFYVDPTHRNPLPPALVGFLLRARGFDRVDIDRRHPADPRLLLQGGEPGLVDPLNRLLFGAQDYAAIGYVPEQD